MASKKTVHNINPDIEGLAFEISKLRVLPGNPRKGDVKSVANSYKEFGQQKPIVARLDEETGIGTVLAGNTQLQAARDELGWTHIAVTWVNEWDDKKSAAFALADNRTHDLGEYDDEKVLEMIAQISDEESLMVASGYDDDFFADLNASFDDGPQVSMDHDLEDLGNILGDDEDEEDDEPRAARAAPLPVIQYQLVFSNESQQQRWFAFVRWLRREYSEEETVSDRLDKFLGSVEGFEES